MTDIIYRPAEKSDASEIAPYIIMVGEGLFEFLFHDLVTDVTPLQMLVQEVERENNSLSYCHTYLAVNNGNIVGISQSCPSAEHRITEEMEGNLPKERLEVVREFFNLRVEDSLYINALATSANFRGQGIGKQMLAFQKQKAIQNGMSSLSLLVLTDNNNAIRFYERQNFHEVKRIKIAPQPLWSHDGMLLMKCPLD